MLFVWGAAALFPLAPLLGADAEGFCAALTAAPFGEFLHPAISDIACDCFTEGLRDSVHEWVPLSAKEKRRHCFSRRTNRYPDQEPQATRHPRTPSQSREGVRKSMWLSPWFHVTGQGSVDSKDFRFSLVLEATQIFCLYVLLIKNEYSSVYSVLVGLASRWVQLRNALL